MKFGQSKFNGGNNNYIEDKNAPVPVVSVTTTPLPPVNLNEETQDLNSTAFSLIRGPEGGFSIATVLFNPVTMEAKVESVKKVSDSREEGEYYLRIRLGEYFADQERKS